MLFCRINNFGAVLMHVQCTHLWGTMLYIFIHFFDDTRCHTFGMSLYKVWLSLRKYMTVSYIQKMPMTSYLLIGPIVQLIYSLVSNWLKHPFVVNPNTKPQKPSTERTLNLSIQKQKLPDISFGLRTEAWNKCVKNVQLTSYNELRDRFQ